MSSISAITIIPGWGLGRGPFEPLAHTLSANIFDLPGYDHTPIIEDFNDAADTLASRVKVDATLIGWSLGGMLSLATAARHPGKIGKVILIGGTASFCCREGWPHAMPAEALAEFSTNVLADFDTLLPRFIGNFNRGDHHAKTITRMLLKQAESKPSKEALSNGLKWLREVDLRPLLPQVYCPVLIIQGAEDPLMPLAAAQQLAKGLSKVQLEILEGAAHTPFLSEPERFLDLVRAFLA